MVYVYYTYIYMLVFYIISKNTYIYIYVLYVTLWILMGYKTNLT